MAVGGAQFVKSKKVIELPEQDENVPGLFTIQMGDSRLILNAQGNEKPPAQVRTLKRPKKTAQSTKRKRGG